MAIISLLLGTLSIISVIVFNFYAWYITVIIGALGIIFGFIGKKRSKISVANAGIILSIIGIVLTFIFLIGFIFIANVFSGFNK